MHAKTGHEHRVGFTLGFAVAWARPEWDQHRIACCEQTHPGEPAGAERAAPRHLVPGVNYLGGSRQLRRRVPPSLPLPWQGEATPKTEPPAGLVVADTSARTCSGAHEPADPTVRRQRGAHLRHLAPGGGLWLAGN